MQASGRTYRKSQTQINCTAENEPTTTGETGRKARRQSRDEIDSCCCCCCRIYLVELGIQQLSSNYTRR